MPTKKRYAIVFIHGLAKKPSPKKLEEIWRWGIERADPNADAFPNPNPGINLNDEGVPCLFNFYADVFYGTDYETEFGSYYEANPDEMNNTEVPVDKGEQVTGAITPPQPETPHEQKFLAEFERQLREQSMPPVPPPLTGRPRPRAEVPGQLEIAAWLPGPVKELMIKQAAMEAYYFLFDKEYSRADGERFKVRGVLRQRLIEVLQGRPSRANGSFSLRTAWAQWWRMTCCGTARIVHPSRRCSRLDRRSGSRKCRTNSSRPTGSRSIFPPRNSGGGSTSTTRSTSSAAPIPGSRRTIRPCPASRSRT